MASKPLFLASSARKDFCNKISIGQRSNGDLLARQILDSRVIERRIIDVFCSLKSKSGK